MIKELNQTCKKVNDAFGISMKLPEPKKNTLKAASALNLIVGTGLVFVGVIFSEKWCSVIGGVGIISGIVMKHESKEI